MTVKQCGATAALATSLCQRIGEPRYLLWFQDKTKFTWNEPTLEVGVPNHFFQEWLAKTFAADLTAVGQEVFGRHVELRFQIDSELFRAARQRERSETAPAVEPTPTAVVHKKARASGRRLRRLADFVVGPCNRVAHASVQSLLESQGHVPLPLVLHGPSGLGKTHLLEAICHDFQERRGDSKVVFVTAEDFTNRFLQAMRHGKLSAFRKQFRGCDALLVDDVDFLAKKGATQEEFLHTLDVLVRNERPVVLTCDAHPRLAEELLPELTDRLLGGSVWGIDLPDPDTRRILIESKLRGLGVHWPRNAVEFLTQELRGNVRALEGALHSVQHFARVAGQPVTLDLVRQALGEVFRHSVKIVQLGDVERSVCRVLGLEAGTLQSKGRGWAFSHPRMLAIYLARKHTGATYQEIGQRWGGRNHSTAVAAEKKVRTWMKEDQSLQLGQRQLRVRDLIDKIERELLR